MRKATALTCAALFALTACGSGDDGAAKENIKTALQDNESDLGGAELSDEQAGCLSDGLVDDIGVDKLQDYGVLDKDNEIVKDAQPDDLSADDADALADVFVGCVDFKEMFADQMGSMSEQMTDEQSQCISDTIDEDAFKDVLSAGFQGETPDFGSDMQSKMMECMTPAQ